LVEITIINNTRADQPVNWQSTANRWTVYCTSCHNVRLSPL